MPNDKLDARREKPSGRLKCLNANKGTQVRSGRQFCAGASKSLFATLLLGCLARESFVAPLNLLKSMRAAADCVARKSAHNQNIRPGRPKHRDICCWHSVARKRAARAFSLAASPQLVHLALSLCAPKLEHAIKGRQGFVHTLRAQNLLAHFFRPPEISSPINR